MRKILKRHLIVLGGLMLFFLLPASASAQEGEVNVDSRISITSESRSSRTVESFKVESRTGKTSEEIEAHREEIKARREAALEEMRERQAERKTRLEEQRAEREAKLEEMAEERETSQSEREEEVDSRLDEIQVERCTRVELNIERQVSRYEENRIRHLNVYTAMSERLKDLLAKLVEQGADVSEVENLINEWDQRIEDFRESGAVVYDRLVATQQVGCNEDDVFVTRLEEARSTWRDSREEAREVRSFFTDNLRPALVALRDRLSE